MEVETGNFATVNARVFLSTQKFAPKGAYLRNISIKKSGFHQAC